MKSTGYTLSMIGACLLIILNIYLLIYSSINLSSINPEEIYPGENRILISTIVFSLLIPTTPAILIVIFLNLKKDNLKFSGAILAIVLGSLCIIFGLLSLYYFLLIYWTIGGLMLGGGIVSTVNCVKNKKQKEMIINLEQVINQASDEQNKNN